MAVAEDMENTPRYKLGFTAGKNDKSSYIESDMDWFDESRFTEQDPAYVAGYQAGFRDTTKKKRK